MIQDSKVIVNEEQPNEEVKDMFRRGESNPGLPGESGKS